MHSTYKHIQTKVLGSPKRVGVDERMLDDVMLVCLYRALEFIFETHRGTRLCFNYQLFRNQLQKKKSSFIILLFGYIVPRWLVSDDFFWLVALNMKLELAEA